MSSTQALLGLLLAGFMGSAAAVGPSYLGNLSGQTVSVGNTFSSNSVINDVINDVYTFDIMPGSAAVGTAVTINLDIPFLAGTEFSLANFGVAFWDSLDNVIVSDVQTSVNDLTVSIFANLSSAIGYQFVVTGNVTGTLGGGYGGVLAAAPIPEPRDWMMMLAGLGLIGMMVSRSRRRM